METNTVCPECLSDRLQRDGDWIMCLMCGCRWKPDLGGEGEGE